MGDHHATFSAANDFVGGNAEATQVANRPDRSAFVGRPGGLGTVFNHFHAMFRGNGKNGVHVGDHAPVVRRQNRNGVLVNQGFQLAGIHLQRFIDITEHRRCAGHRTSECRSDKPHTWDDKFLARSGTDGDEGRLQRAGTVAHRESMLHRKRVAGKSFEGVAHGRVG